MMSSIVLGPRTPPSLAPPGSEPGTSRLLRRLLLSGLALLAPAQIAGCARTQVAVAVPTIAGAPTPGTQEAARIAGYQALASGSADPVAERLVLYLRLLAPGGGSAAEIDDFLHRNPTWPNRGLLTQRLDQAIASETDVAALGSLCGTATLASSESLLRCSSALLPSQPGADTTLPLTAAIVPPAIIQAARTAWVNGIDQPDRERAFLHSWGRFLTADDNWQRFDRLEWIGNVAAANRVIPLLQAGQQQLATARLSLRRNADGADGVAAALQGDASRDPVLALDLARWLRRRDRPDDALALWKARGFTAETRVSRPRLTAFWTERDALARDLLRDHHDADALVMADDSYQIDPSAQVDGAFLTGWISLRRLHDPAGAEARFSHLLSSTSAITRSRGDYWTGRARLARSDVAGGRAALTEASAFPTTFYGQLAIARLYGPASGLDILLDPSLDRSVLATGLGNLHDPRWTSAQAIDFAGLELARAAETLVAWNDPRHARAFLLKLDQSVSSDTEHALAASLAVRLGLPDVAVAIARSAARHGLVLAGAGWPRPYAPPPSPVLPPGLALAVMRQESSFDPQIASPAGARGLMQLTSGTARDTARTLGRPDLTPGPDGASLFDPDVNLALGTAYLGGLMTRFRNVAPYAIAAYNAGSHRVDRWLVENGDATAGAGTADDAQARMIDWIEMIPFAETRNYVQRVIENMGVYQNDPGGRA